MNHKQRPTPPGCAHSSSASRAALRGGAAPASASRRRCSPPSARARPARPISGRAANSNRAAVGPCPGGRPGVSDGAPPGSAGTLPCHRAGEDSSTGRGRPAGLRAADGPRGPLSRLWGGTCRVGSDALTSFCSCGCSCRFVLLPFITISFQL